LFDGENISFEANLVVYTYSINIPPIVIINRIYEHQNLLSLQLVSFLVGIRTYQNPCRLDTACGGCSRESAATYSGIIVFSSSSFSGDAAGSAATF